MGREGLRLLPLPGGSVRSNGPQGRRRPQQRPGLQPAQLPGQRLVSGQLVHVQRLAGHHAVSAAGPGQGQNRIGPLLPGQAAGGGDHPEGLPLEGVPRQHGHGLAVDLVAGGAAPAEIVVVHAGQIIVDQGVGVDQLQGAAQGQGQTPVPAQGLAHGHGQHRAHPLAPG